MIKIRNAGTGDSERITELLKQIGDLHHKARPDIFKGSLIKYNFEELQKVFDNPEKRVFVAEFNAEKEINNNFVCGYAFCEIIKYNNHKVFNDYKSLYIDDLCVDENYRNMGIGSMLFEKCKEFAKEINCYNIDLNVWEFNQSAMRFYEKCGMSVQRRRMECILS